MEPVKDVDVEKRVIRPLASTPNNDFYMSIRDSERIMNPECFSAEVTQFLHDERNHLTKVLLQEQYECIIEVGCHAGHNSEWLAALCTQYIGVDINKAAIDHALQKKPRSGCIDFLCTSVEKLRSLVLPEGKYPRRKLVLFPFNLFGNFINVVELIEMLDMAGVDLAMSNFNTRSDTTIGRYNYYVNCFGNSSIRVYDAEQGVLFKAGQKFRSIAYKPEYLTKLVHDISRHHGIITPFSTYGDLFLLTT
ncbi:MAG: class I SAM-dependent methyltransferase [Burkholderiales bacterium]|nr:class I SAM-dependent methyltransferase [Burkholderiales bacterium]